ncbi:MAG: hypothetical protein HAW66_04675, partial [Shewanella sp.]|nr:hypothetical protein [Shewanella sp.]
MTLAYSNSHQHSVFNQAKIKFDSMISHLESSAVKYNEHGEVEDYIDVEGTEVLRCLFQGCLDKKAAEEPLQQIYSDDGTHLTHL